MFYSLINVSRSLLTPLRGQHVDDLWRYHVILPPVELFEGFSRLGSLAFRDIMITVDIITSSPSPSWLPLFIQQRVNEINWFHTIIPSPINAILSLIYRQHSVVIISSSINSPIHHYDNRRLISSSLKRDLLFSKVETWLPLSYNYNRTCDIITLQVVGDWRSWWFKIGSAAYREVYSK